MKKNIKKSIIGAGLFAIVLCVGLFVASVPLTQNNPIGDSNAENEQVDHAGVVANIAAQKNTVQADVLKTDDNFPKTESEVYNYSFSGKNSEAEVNRALQVVLADKKAQADFKASNNLFAGDSNSANANDLEYNIDNKGQLTIQQISGASGFEPFDSNVLPPWQQDDEKKYSIKSVNVNGTVNPKDATAWFANVRELDTRADAMKIESFTGLANMTLPAGCGFLFCGCTHVNSCDGLPVMTDVENACAMFSGASFDQAIIELAVTQLSAPTNLAHAFGQCPNLQSANLSNVDLSSAENLSCMFLNDTALTTVSADGKTATKATTFNSMFYGCSALINATVKDLVNCDEASSVSDVSLVGMFEKTSLTELDISGWHTAKVSNVSYMFNKCASLTKISTNGNIDFSTLAKEKALDLFEGCIQLKGAEGTSYQDYEKVKGDNPATFARGDDNLENGTTDTPGFFSISTTHKFKLIGSSAGPYFYKDIDLKHWIDTSTGSGEITVKDGRNILISWKNTNRTTMFNFRDCLPEKHYDDCYFLINDYQSDSGAFIYNGSQVDETMYFNVYSTSDVPSSIIDSIVFRFWLGEEYYDVNYASTKSKIINPTATFHNYDYTNYRDMSVEVLVTGENADNYGISLLYATNFYDGSNKCFYSENNNLSFNGFYTPPGSASYSKMDTRVSVNIGKYISLNQNNVTYTPMMGGTTYNSSSSTDGVKYKSSIRLVNENKEFTDAKIKPKVESVNSSAKYTDQYANFRTWDGTVTEDQINAVKNAKYVLPTHLKSTNKEQNSIRFFRVKQDKYANLFNTPSSKQTGTLKSDIKKEGEVFNAAPGKITTWRANSGTSTTLPQEWYGGTYGSGGYTPDWYIRNYGNSSVNYLYNGYYEYASLQAKALGLSVNDGTTINTNNTIYKSSSAGVFLTRLFEY